MARYITRRLLLTIPTLIGISVVTFILVHLAPGTPVGTEMALSLQSHDVEEELKEYSRAYFLHLPLFVNVNVQDIRKDVDDLLYMLRDKDKQEFIRRQLIYMGGATLPYILPRLEEMKPEELEIVLDALERVAERMGVAGDLKKSEDPASFWRSYWSYYKMDYRKSRARRLVDRFINFNDELAYKEIVRLDTYAFPAVFEVLKGERDTGRIEALVKFVEHATGKQPAGVDKDDAEGMELVVSGWEDWWWRYEDEFSSCDGLCRIYGVVTKTRYFHWVQRLFKLDFGISITDGRSINEKLKERLPVTLLLSMLALLISYVVSVPLGIYSAMNVGKPMDKVISLLLFILYSLPSFWLAIILIRLLCGVGTFDIFPIQGLVTQGSEAWPIHARALDLLHHLVLPVLCLSYVSFATLSRYQRSATLEVLRQDYIRTARAKGLGETAVVIRHVLKNSLIPIVTLLGVQIPFLIGGSVIVERIFGIEGMGLETFEAIRNRDYNWILSVAFITSMLTVAGMLISDILYAVIDPRISYQKR
ncbi:MAG: ABC transporter permease subunit [Pseudomonadota bacterium]